MMLHMPEDVDNRLLAMIAERLADGSDDPAALQTALDMTLAHFNCVVGTIHRWNATGNDLEIVAARGVPELVLDRVRRIPIGKGMAGLAAERREPVQVCNLQSDTSGVAKPGSKLTEMEGSLAAPILVGGELRGTIGVAMPRPHEFTPAQCKLLMRIGAIIGGQW